MRAFQTSGRSLHLDGAGEQLPLELEPEDDVQPVGHLVRVAADQRRAARRSPRGRTSSSSTPPSASGKSACSCG